MVTRSVSESATVNSRRFGSAPAEICGDLREHLWVATVQTARNPPRCTPVREGWGGRCRVAAGPPAARRWAVGGLDRRTLWRSVVLVEAGCHTGTSRARRRAESAAHGAALSFPMDRLWSVAQRAFPSS